MKKGLYILLAGMLLLASCRPKQNTEETEPTSKTSGFIVHSEGWTGTSGTEPTETETEKPPEDPTESGSEAESASETEPTPSETEPESPTTARVDCAALDTDSEAFAVVDETGALYMGQNENAPYAPASITKVLTALVVCERASLDNVVPVSETAVNNVDIMSSGVTPSFKPGEQITVRDLLYALILPSTNAAGSILAEHCAGSNEAFAVLMNEKAAALGCTNSHFMNPHGLDQEGHYTSAHDMALIFRAAMMNEKLAPILGAKYHEIPATRYASSRTMGMGHAMVNGNYPLSGVFAGKTGSTVLAGKTLVTAVTRGGKTFYVCTLHSDEGMHYVDTDNIIRWAYAKWTGTKTNLIRFAHNLELVASGPTGADFTYEVANTGASGYAVFWDLRAGVASAVTVPVIPVERTNRIHLAFPSYGPYHVQIFVRDEAGNENAVQADFLHCGTVHTPGLQQWNGQTYLVDPGEKIGVGPCETAGAAYFANTDGGLGKGFVGGKYYAGADFKLVKGWVEAGGSKYYIQADGRIVKGDYVIGGVLYHFTDDGRLIP